MASRLFGKNGEPLFEPETSVQNMFAQCGETVEEFLTLLRKSHGFSSQFSSTIEDVALQQNHLIENQTLTQKGVGAATGQLKTALSGIARLETRLKNVESRWETLEHNIEQLRAQSDGISRKLGETTAEFIEREVRDPFLLELLRIRDLLSHATSSSASSGQDPFEEAIERIDSVFDSHDLALIHPLPGDAFQPRLHQPIERRPAHDPEQTGRIAKTYRSGLNGGERVIATAKVAVFAATTPDSKTQSEGGQDNG